MCRLLGYCARGSTSVADLMGEDGLRDFTLLSAYHCDGWGMAWYAGTRPQVRKSPLRAADEPAFGQLAHSRLGDLGLVHLRWATPGLPVEPRNTHPFRRDGYTMAHNGAIHPQDRLGELLPPGWERHLAGTTDSERYFLHVLARLEARGGDMVAALADTVTHIDREFQVNSLNAILLAPDALYAVAFHDPDRVPLRELVARGYDGPPEGVADYFELAYRVAASAVVVASSGWGSRDWVTLPNRHVLVVDRATLAATVLPLAA